MRKVKKTMKKMLSATMMAGAVTGVSFGITQIVTAMEFNEVEQLQTVYNVPVIAESNQAELHFEAADPLDESVKPDYTISDDGLEHNQKPSAHEISREKAAEIGVQELEFTYDLDLKGKNIEMGFDLYYDGMGVTRTKWSGICWVDGKKGADPPVYTFVVDAVTGEISSTAFGGIGEEKVGLGFNAVEPNPSQFEEIEPIN
jgi:hypothetical protein